MRQISLLKLYIIEAILLLAVASGIVLKLMDVGWYVVLMFFAVQALCIFYFPFYPLATIKNYSDESKLFKIVYAVSFFSISVSIACIHFVSIGVDSTASLEYFRFMVGLTAVAFWVNLFAFRHKGLRLLVMLGIVAIIDCLFFI